MKYALMHKVVAVWCRYFTRIFVSHPTSKCMLEVVKLNTRGVFLGPCHMQKQPPEMFRKKAAEVFFKISQNSQESTCVGVSFRSLKKRLKRRCFSVKCAQFLRFKNSYFEKKIFKQLTASVHDCDRIGIS